MRQQNDRPGLGEPEEWNAVVLGAGLPVWRPVFRSPAPTALTISADEVRASVIGRTGPADPKGLTIQGAVIEGVLDLSGAVVDFPLRFACCRFVNDVVAEQSRLRSLELDGSAFSGRLLLSGCLVAGHLSLHGAALEGRGDDGASLIGDGLRVADSVHLDEGFSSMGTIRLTGSHVGGDFVLDGAKLTGADADRVSLAADGVRVDGKVSMSNGFTSAGTVRLVGAGVGAQLAVRDASLLGRDAAGNAFVADSLKVTGNAVFGPELTADGAIRLVGGHIGGELTMRGAHLLGADDDGVSLVAARLRVDDNTSLDEDFIAHGAVKLIGARLAGHLSMTGAKLLGQTASAPAWSPIASGSTTTCTSVRWSAQERSDCRVHRSPAVCRWRVLRSRAPTTLAAAWLRTDCESTPGWR
ncbi:hypothetical protein EV652_10411 [Kribbella steppae]|uniref:Uncharacterized protein n=1 Tax=Kribbella steppae TaxID=2512223 RepID=A0A4R2HR02_9ACTN|nr:hypothetical protein EV652_10411 [Kribbella steppae]